MRRATRLSVALLLLAGVIAGLTRLGWPSGRESEAAAESSADRFLRAGLEREAAFDFEGALEAFRAAIELDPFLLEAHLGYQESKRWLWRGHELPAEYRVLRDRHPKSALHQFLYALAVERRNPNWRAVAREYERAISLDSSFAWPYAYRYRSYTFPDAGEHAAVIGSLRQCAQLAPRLPACYEQLGEFSRLSEDFKTAVTAYEKALAMDSTSRERPMVHLGLVESLLELGQTAAAFEALDRAFSEFGSGDDLRGQYRFLTDFVDRVEFSWRQPDRSEETAARLANYRDRALKRLDDLRGGRNPLLRAWLLTWSATGAPRRANEETGLKLLSQAIADSTLIKSQSWTAYLRRCRCRLLRHVAELEAARKDCLAAVKVSRATRDSLELMRGLHELTHVEEGLGELDRALEVAEEYLALTRRIGNDNHPFSALHDLGWIAWKTGDHRRGREALEEMAALAVRKDRWLYEVAAFYEALGDYSKALEFYYRGARDSTASARRAYGNYGRSVAGLSRLYLKLGDLPRSLEYGLEYDSYVRSVGIADVPFPTLAAVYRAQGRSSDAIRYAEEWLAEAEHVGSRSAAAEARRELALSLAAAGRPKEAISHLRSMLHEYEAMGRFWDQGPVLLALSDAYLLTKQLDSAAAFLGRARDHASRTRDPETTWRVEFLNGKLLEKMGREDEALSAYTRAIHRVEANQANMPTPDLLTWFRRGRLGPYESAIRLYLKRGDGASIDQAFQLTERKKARALLELVATAGIKSGEQGAPTLLRRKAGIEARLAAARFRLRSAYERAGDGRPDTERIERLRAEVDSLAFRYTEVLAEFESSGPREAWLGGYTEPLDLGAVQRSLRGAHQALLEYTFVEDHLVAFVVTRTSSHVVRLAATEGDVRTAVEKLRGSLEALKRGEISLVQAHWDMEAASQLYEQLVRPVEHLLGGVSELVIVPEGVLWHIPFEALVVRRPPGPSPGRVLFERYEQAKFLIDRYAVAYSPSAALLDPGLWPRRDPEGDLLVMADPDLSRTRAAVSIGAGLTTVLPQPIPATRVEAETVARYATHPTVLLGEEATEGAFYREAPSYRTIHLAAHTVVEERMPLYSGIWLASDSTTDGFLQAYELFDVTLAADLVVLSACETGVGQIRAGEGMLTLSRAFMAAGVPSLVASLWIVPDVKGSPLMREFYQQLRAGATKIEALRAAKLATKDMRITMAGGQVVSLAHPIFWAPFVLTGLPD